MSTSTTKAATAVLADAFPAGGTVSTLTDREGETRRVRVLGIDPNGLIRDYTTYAALILPYKLDKRDRLIFKGVGTNAGEGVTRSLSAVLHRDADALAHRAV